MKRGIARNIKPGSRDNRQNLRDMLLMLDASRGPQRGVLTAMQASVGGG